MNGALLAEAEAAERAARESGERGVSEAIVMLHLHYAAKLRRLAAQVA